LFVGVFAIAQGQHTTPTKAVQNQMFDSSNIRFFEIK